MTKDEFINKVINFIDQYTNEKTVNIELLEELNGYAINTDIYQQQKQKADFDGYSYEDVFYHMCHKIIGAPFLATLVAALCIPFIYEKYIQERGVEG